MKTQITFSHSKIPRSFKNKPLKRPSLHPRLKWLKPRTLVPKTDFPPPRTTFTSVANICSCISAPASCTCAILCGRYRDSLTWPLYSGPTYLLFAAQTYRGAVGIVLKVHLRFCDEWWVFFISFFIEENGRFWRMLCESVLAAILFAIWDESGF